MGSHRQAHRGPPRTSRADAAGAAPGAGRLTLGCCLILALAGTMAYLPSFRGVFLLDDYGYIVVSEDVKTLLPVSKYFRDPRPVLLFSLALNYAAGGEDLWGYHLVNLGIHLAAGLLLFGLVRRSAVRWLERGACHGRAGDAASEAGVRRSAAWFAFAVSLLWVVHPLQTQSVTYIIQRGESLMGLCYLGTLYSFIRGVDSSRPFAWYLCAFVACAAGMATKAVMVTAPIVVLLYDRVFVAPSWGEVVRRRWAVHGALLSTGGLLLVLGVVGSLTRPQGFVGPTTVGFDIPGLSWSSYLLTQPAVILHYLRLVLWPAGLCFDYAWPMAGSLRYAILPGAVLVGLLAATIVALLRRPALGFVGAWFFLILAPTSSFIPVKDACVEHRMYLPLAGVLTLLVFLIVRLPGRDSYRGGMAPAGRGRVFAAALAAAAFAFAARTFVRNLDYASAAAMWGDVVQQRPQNARAWNAYGVALSVEGRLAPAIAAYRHALELNPEFEEARINLAKALAGSDRTSEAVEVYREALAHAPNDAAIRHSLAIALEQLGRPAEAISEYRETIRLRPDHPNAHYNLALALMDQHRWAEAAESLRASMRLRANDARARFRLGWCLKELGRPDEARNELEAALRLDPALAPARQLLEQLHRAGPAIRSTMPARRTNEGS